MTKQEERDVKRAVADELINLQFTPNFARLTALQVIATVAAIEEQRAYDEAMSLRP